MQHSGCDEVQLLISRYVDDEVTAAERTRVDEHVTTCESCACKLIEYMEVAVLFSEAAPRRPDADLRASVFREIGAIREEARRKEAEEEARRNAGWLGRLVSPAEPSAVKSSGSLAMRLLKAASPAAMAAAALFVFLGALTIGGYWSPSGPRPEGSDDEGMVVHAPSGLPTLEAPVNVVSDAPVPGPMSTRVAGLASPAASSSAYVHATATLGRAALLKLTNPTPVYEDGSAADKASWHVVRDPAFGYTASYPPNWWTYVLAETRYFYPWNVGGTRYAPYWVELRVTPNMHHLEAGTGNDEVCAGACALVEGMWLRRSGSENGATFDEAYRFDDQNIYRLRVTVPMESADGMETFSERLAEAENVFGLMSFRFGLVSEQGQSPAASAYQGLLFLNGGDLMLTRYDGGGTVRVTSQMCVKQYALSPDMTRVAFSASDNTGDVWGTAIYLVRVSADGAATPGLVLSGMHIYDLAWYSDRELLAIARVDGEELGVYRLALPPKGTAASDTTTATADRIVSLDEGIATARSLQVSPDRQLITFLAPIGAEQGTDLYAVRPDGTGLTKVIAHTDAISTIVDGKPVLAPENQAIKSYVWADGRLEADGFLANLFYTCGNFAGPTGYPGGALYWTLAGRNPAADPFALTGYTPERMQIVHVAYSPYGKVAMAGYFSDYNGRADQLAGLWTADMVAGQLENITKQPGPPSPNGLTDLQWSPDGERLVYREVIPASGNSATALYDGSSAFRIMSLSTASGQTMALYEAPRR